MMASNDTAKRIAIAWYTKRCEQEYHQHIRRVRLASSIIARNPPEVEQPPKPPQDPTTIPPIVDHAVQPPKDPELAQIPDAKAESWMHRWLLRAPKEVGMSFLRAYGNFFLAAADGPVEMAKLVKKLVKPAQGESRWSPDDTHRLMTAVADVARVPVAAVYFGMIPTPFPKPWAWFTPSRADSWAKGTSTPTVVEKTLLPSRYTKGPQPKPGEQTSPPDLDPSVKKTPVSSVRLPKIVQANRRVGMVDRQLDQSKSRSTRGTRRSQR